MLISYHGHSEFCLEGADGFCLLTDPYDDHVGYPMKKMRCDAVTVSHGHGDHSDTKKALGNPAIVDSQGIWMIAPDVTVTAIPAFHDEMQGAKRGNNLIMKIEMEGLSIAHLGDLGEMITPGQLKALGKIDILLIPVGGYYTIDSAQAKEITEKIAPRMVIPMHYKAAGVNEDWPISDEREFLSLMNAKNAPACPLLRVTKEDLSQHPSVVLMDWKTE